MSGIYEADGGLGAKLVANMVQITDDRISSDALSNAHRNHLMLANGQSLAALRGQSIGQGDSCIVVAAGPSIKRRNPIAMIKDAGYKGAIITTESAIAYCLKSGVVPDLVVTLDPHATRIVRWFGDPSLNEEALAQDDYYRRQDMDEAFANELEFNQEILNLVNEHGKDMKIALATSASEAVVSRVLETGMEIYWWNPMLDDPNLKGSKTREMFDLNSMPCVNAGGNVGASCWMMADAVLEKKYIGLTGMDFSYYEDTPPRNTQYYHEIVDLVGEENLDSVFMRVQNPHLASWFYTDPAYMWYRNALLEMVAGSDSRTTNCTEGGIVFGDGIEFVPLMDFLHRHI